MSRSERDRPRDDTDGEGDDWAERHARIEPRRTGRAVRYDPPSDDWAARHSRTRSNV